MGRYFCAQNSGKEKRIHMEKERNFDDMVECHYHGSVMFVPIKLFLNATMRMKCEGSKYIRFREGAKMYNLSRNTFIKLAEDAKAVSRPGKVALVNVKILDEYLKHNNK